MVLLKNHVACMLCNQNVLKLDTVVVDQKFACYPCFKNNRMLFDFQQGLKMEMYCEGCKYKFNSKRLMCPYCSKSDRLVRANVRMRDLV